MSFSDFDCFKTPVVTIVELGPIGKLAGITWHKLPHATGWQARCPKCRGTMYTPVKAHRTMVQRCLDCKTWVQVP